MTKEEIDDIVCEIMINDGPDRHVDGHEIITDFIMALLSGEGHKWKEGYLNGLSLRATANLNLSELISRLNKHL